MVFMIQQARLNLLPLWCGRSCNSDMVNPVFSFFRIWECLKQIRLLEFLLVDREHGSTCPCIG